MCCMPGERIEIVIWLSVLENLDISERRTIALLAFESTCHNRRATRRMAGGNLGVHELRELIGKPDCDLHTHA